MLRNKWNQIRRIFLFFFFSLFSSVYINNRELLCDSLFCLSLSLYYIFVGDIDFSVRTEPRIKYTKLLFNIF